MESNERVDELTKKGSEAEMDELEPYLPIPSWYYQLIERERVKGMG